VTDYNKLFESLIAKPIPTNGLRPGRVGGGILGAPRLTAPPLTSASIPTPRPPQSWIYFSDPPFADLPFAGPYFLASASILTYGGLYAILVPDASSRPKPYRLVYIGESGNLSERVCTSHENHSSWVRAAGGASGLYVAFHYITDQTARRATEKRVIAYYKPECNGTHKPWSDLYGR
jgi:hypothetical protein